MATEPQRVVRAEHRLPAVIAIVIVLFLYALLPSSFLPEIRYSVVAIAILLLIPVLILNPARLTKQTPWSRVLSMLTRRVSQRIRGSPPRT